MARDMERVAELSTCDVAGVAGIPSRIVSTDELELLCLRREGPSWDERAVKADARFDPVMRILDRG